VWQQAAETNEAVVSARPAAQFTIENSFFQSTSPEANYKEERLIQPLFSLYS
jgi:hypothetical protein